jgi:hypothetical protein
LICTWDTSGACKAPTGASICTLVASISNDDACDLRTTVGSCYNVSGTCTVKQTACTSYSYSGSANDSVKVSDC